MRGLLGIVIGVVILCIMYWLWFSKQNTEGFFTNQTVEEQIIRLYVDTLNRQPTGQELIEYERKISKKQMTLDGLRQKLIDSEEYERHMKTQTNALAPELNRMLSDKLLIEKIAVIYKEEKRRTVPPKLVLPYKDIYIHLDYNEYTFRAFLRSSEFDEFEQDLLRMENMSKEDVIRAFDKKFKKDELVKEGIKIQKEYEAKMGKLQSNKNEVDYAPTKKKIMRSVMDTDTDSRDMIKGISNTANEIFDKDLEARCMSKDNQTKIVLTHHGDMVLRPEFAWSVPHQRAPVCTTIGQAPLVQPVMVNSTLLLGTPLNEAATETAVGSIMPKFQYKEYVGACKDSLNKSCK